MVCEYNVNLYCSEDISLIENYDKAINDKENMWECHHKLETELGLSKRELIENKLYYERPASELIFLTFEEHRNVHKFGSYKSKKHRENLSKSLKNVSKTIEHRKHLSDAKIGSSQPNISKALKGRVSTFKGKHHSEESKKKLSIAHKGKKLSDEAKLKCSLNGIKGKHRVWNEDHTSFHYE